MARTHCFIALLLTAFAGCTRGGNEPATVPTPIASVVVEDLVEVDNPKYLWWAKQPVGTTVENAVTTSMPGTERPR